MEGIEIKVLRTVSFYEGTLEEFTIDQEIQKVRASRIGVQTALLTAELEKTQGLLLRAERKCQVFEIACWALAIFLICAVARLWS